MSLGSDIRDIFTTESARAFDLATLYLGGTTEEQAQAAAAQAAAAQAAATSEAATQQAAIRYGAIVLGAGVLVLGLVLARRR
ncbi:MAG: hypothetical protein RJB55_585 [Verrucomicrobiota bacterium]